MKMLYKLYFILLYFVLIYVYVIGVMRFKYCIDIVQIFNYFWVISFINGLVDQRV